jgi:hypothetical protein
MRVLVVEDEEKVADPIVRARASLSDDRWLKHRPYSQDA